MGRSDLGDTVEMVLTQGGTFEGGFQLTDEFGSPIDSTWRGRLEIRERIGGPLVATFAAPGTAGADGTLTINDYGQVLLTIASSATSALEPTSDSLGLNARTYIGSVEVWDNTFPAYRYTPEAPFRVFVRPEVTTG